MLRSHEVTNVEMHKIHYCVVCSANQARLQAATTELTALKQENAARTFASRNSSDVTEGALSAATPVRSFNDRSHDDDLRESRCRLDTAVQQAAELQYNADAMATQIADLDSTVNRLREVCYRFISIPPGLLLAHSCTLSFNVAATDVFVGVVQRPTSVR